MAAFFRAYANDSGLSADEKLSVTSIIDLRRHLLPGKELEGCTNMVAFMKTEIDCLGETYTDTLKKVSDINSNNKKDDMAGLYGLPLLALAYKIFFPDFISALAIKAGYHNPYVQMSNIGICNFKDITFEGCRPYDILLTGAVKKKPYLQLACATVDTHMNLCVAEYCSDSEERRILRLLNDIVKMLEEFAYN